MFHESRRQQVDQARYDVAQICRNGHVVTSSSVASPEQKQNFCNQCGAPTVTACEHCDTPIRGDYDVPGVIGIFEYSPPAFCHNCGKPYPWTKARLLAAQELADELDGLTPEEKATLKASLDDLVRDTPQTPVAATRFKRLLAKAGRVAADNFKTILIEVVTEAVKKQLWPQ